MSQTYRNRKSFISSVIKPTDDVLDVGFWGQGIGPSDPNWLHGHLRKVANETYGVDLELDETRFTSPRYRKMSAEEFEFPRDFDAVFASELIEHLSNPGLFLRRADAALRENGRLILTTPNCFNLFNLAEKMAKPEPTVNKDHTCYYNFKTLRQLLRKNGWVMETYGFILFLDMSHQESWKKKFLNLLYRFVSLLTPKYAETLYVIARRSDRKAIDHV